VWQVDTFIRDGVEVAPLVSDGSRWRRIAFDRGGAPSAARLTLWHMDETRVTAKAQLDAAKHTLTIDMPRGAIPMELVYERTDADHVTLEGAIDGTPTRIALRRLPLESVKLARPFRWVREHLFRD
jgi:hypothetical protein